MVRFPTEINSKASFGPKILALGFLWVESLGKNLSKEIPTVMISIRLHSQKRNKAMINRHSTTRLFVDWSTRRFSGDVWGLGFYSWKKNPSSVIPEVASRSVATTEVMQKPTHSRNGGLGFATSWISARLNWNPLITPGSFVSKLVNFVTSTNLNCYEAPKIYESTVDPRRQRSVADALLHGTPRVLNTSERTKF